MEWAVPAIACSHQTGRRVQIVWCEKFLVTGKVQQQAVMLLKETSTPTSFLRHFSRITLEAQATALGGSSSKQGTTRQQTDSRGLALPACNCARDTRLLYDAPRMCVGAALPSDKAMGKPLCVLCCSAASTFATDSTVRKPTTPVAIIISAVSVCSLQETRTVPA